MSRGFLLFFAIGLLRHLHCFGGLDLHGLHRFHGIHHIGLGGGGGHTLGGQALGAAALMEPAVGALARHGWRRSVAAGLVTLAVLAAAVGAVYALASKGVDMLTDFARQVPELVASAEQTLARLEARMLEYIAAAPQGVSGYLESALDSLGESLYKLPAALSQWGLELVARTAQASPDTLLFAVTAGIGTYFASASYPQLTAFLAAQIPAGLRRRFSGVGGNLFAPKMTTTRAQIVQILYNLEGTPAVSGTTPFTDLTDDWYQDAVLWGYQTGVVAGTSATTFSPDGKFTVAQALTAAANIHKAYFGGSIDTSVGGLWYMPYVDYCVANGIIRARQFSDMNALISRGDMAIVFANILPDAEYTATRSGQVPDVADSLGCYAAVMKLYNAGIVGGDAGTGKYRPEDSISRAEACVIFTRIAAPEYRQK